MPNNPIIDTDEKRLRESVCIDTKRIFDSCVSKDCLEDLRVAFSPVNQRLIDDAVTIKTRDCTLAECSIDVEEVAFNRGFYNVDITFFFKILFDTYSNPVSAPQTAVGYCSFNKRCILFGGDGDVRVFSSNQSEELTNVPVASQYINPVAKVQAVDPVVLSTDVLARNECPIPRTLSFPQSIQSSNDEGGFGGNADKAVVVTLGLFSIIQMERDTQILINACDYCIPERECSCTTSSPCDAFQSIDFPVDDFFPADRDALFQTN